VHTRGVGLGPDVVTTVAADGPFELTELTELAADDCKVLVVRPADSGLVGEYVDNVDTWAAASAPR